jgi:serine/threonine protein kinase
MLLPVIDAAETGDALLLVMLRAGSALSAILPIAEADAVAVLTDVASGLQQLHLAGILHRDLKPLNVLQHDGLWKLADFGIARDEEIGTQDPTFIGAGSLPYMAPELWQLKSPTVKSDLYALGCLGYELLTGRPPYTGDLQALRTAHLIQAPPDPPYSNPTLKSLIARLVAKEPGDRPQDARAVLDRLHRAALPRSLIQHAIAQGLEAHQAERSHAAAQAAAAEAATVGRLQQVIEGEADLVETFNDALCDLQQIEPDATLEHWKRTLIDENNYYIKITAFDIDLRVAIWENLATCDDVLIAGLISIRNPRQDSPTPSANIAYLPVKGRYAWQIFRFRGTAELDSQYKLENSDQRGKKWGNVLNLPAFLHLYWKFARGYDSAHFQIELLTPETALKLFQEAVDLKYRNR